MELDSKADVVVSLKVDDGSIVVEALPLVLADCKVDCNIDVGLDCVGPDTELEVDGVMFVDWVCVLIGVKDSEVLGDPDATEVDSVVCAILLVLTYGIVDPILPVALVWEWVDSVLALSVEVETVAVTVLAPAAVVVFSADVVVSLAIDDGSIVVASVLLVLAYDIVDCNIDVELVSIWLDTVLELAVDGVKFVDLVSTLVEDKDSELLGELTVTVVDSVFCAILLVLTSGVVDPVLTASLVWERVDSVLALSVDCVDVSGVGTERNNVICSCVAVFKISKIYWK